MIKTRADATLAVTCDDPGVRFFLDRSAAGLAVHDVFVCVGLVVMGGMLLPPFFMMAAFLRDRPDATGEMPVVVMAVAGAFVAIWVLGLLGMMAGALRATRRVEQLHVDGVTSELRIREKGLLGLVGRDEKIPTSRVAKLALAIVNEHPRELTLSLPTTDLVVRMAWWVSERQRAGGRPTGEVGFRVVGLDKREEVLDLALRIGAAAGFASYHVVRSDPRDLEIELDRHSVGDQPMPALGRVDYARDAVAPEARAAAREEKVPPFDVAHFKSDYRVREWKPGERVVFYKAFPWGVLGCLPFVAIPLVLEAMLIAGVGTVTGSRLALHLVLAIFSLAVLLPFVALVIGSRPRRVAFDWGTRRISVGREPPIPMSAVTALELRGVKVHHRPSKGSSYWSYRCEVDLHHADAARGQPTVTRLVETASTRDDGAPAWRCALPLATDLAKALGVERRVVDYKEKR
jgi:hypothetical protein